MPIKVRGAGRLIWPPMRRIIVRVWYPHGITSRGRFETPGAADGRTNAPPALDPLPLR